MLVFLAAALLAGTSAPAVPSGPPAATTYWEGFMRRGVSELPVRFEFTLGSPSSGTFSAPDLGAIDVPLSHVQAGDRLRWELVGDSTTTAFDAGVDGNTLTGTFAEDKEPVGTLSLHRVPSAAARPYRSEQVTFANGGVTLAGTLLLPRSAGKHAAAVLVAGSGAEGRWALAYVADYLARHDVVALTYDKRGVGASTGDWRSATMEDLIGDASAAVEVLARRAEVDPLRLGVYGHSQGGELAPGIAVKTPAVKWLIAADGPVGPSYLQDIFRVDTLLAKQFSGADLAAAERLYAEFVDVARNGGSHQALRADIEKAGHPPWLDYLGIPDDASWLWSWYRNVGNYDNSAAWAGVTVPVLLIFGANDQLVEPHATIEATQRILNGRGRTAAVRLFAGVDHTLRLPPADKDGWPRNAPGLLPSIATFAQRSSGADRAQAP